MTEWRIPAPETFAGVIRDYFALGVEHIFGGIERLSLAFVQAGACPGAQ